MSYSPAKFEKPAPEWSHPFEQPRENNLGLTGFIVSVLGLVFTCGLLSPVGLLISLAGLLSRPRGYAIAGVITGLLGSLGIVLLAGAVWLMAAIAIVAKPVVQHAIVEFGEMATTVNKMVEAKAKIEEFRAKNERLPDGVEGNKLVAEFKDSKGNPLRFDVTEGGYKLRSAGEDGKFETPDDLDSTQLDGYVQVIEEAKRNQRGGESKNDPAEVPGIEIPEIVIPKL